jgi:hypothetical protein
MIRLYEIKAQFQLDADEVAKIAIEHLYDKTRDEYRKAIVELMAESNCLRLALRCEE